MSVTWLFTQRPANTLKISHVGASFYRMPLAGNTDSTLFLHATRQTILTIERLASSEPTGFAYAL